ncbi:MAG: YfiR family protein [Methylovulum sp.]|nr:YfiR family protein [Methylovulum sp.]
MSLPRFPLFWLCLIGLLFLPVLYADDSSVEYKIKAGYLYNFTKFITWPADGSSTFNLCILGADPFGNLIDTIEQRSASGRPIKLFRLERLTGEPHCHILFASTAKALAMGQGGGSTLTVGENEGFAAQGGMIGFVNKDSRIKLQINLPAIRQNGLQISAKLLEVADIIGGNSHD